MKECNHLFGSEDPCAARMISLSKLRCCTCEDASDKGNQLTLEPIADPGGEGIIALTTLEEPMSMAKMGMSAKPLQGSKDFVLSTLEKTGQIKTPDILRFKVSLTKSSNENFGLAHMPMEDGSASLLVVELRPEGPIDRYNAEQRGGSTPQNQVKAGDRIVAVGNAADLEGMRQRLRQDEVEFSVERWPEVINVSLKKRTPTDKFGMQTDLIIRDDRSKVLRVGRISGGLLGEWNTLAAGARRFFDVVGPFSEILSVSGIKGDPERMQQLLVTGTSVDVCFKRPDPELYNH